MKKILHGFVITLMTIFNLSADQLGYYYDDRLITLERCADNASLNVSGVAASTAPSLKSNGANITSLYKNHRGDTLYVKSQIIVRMEDDCSLSAILDRYQGVLTMNKQSADCKYLLDCHVASSDEVLALAQEIHQLDFVKWCEPNFVTKIKYCNPLFSQQYYLQNTGQTGGTSGIDINVVPAWNIVTGSNAVTVAVIDSGVDNAHEDMNGCVLSGYTVGNTAGNGTPGNGSGHGYDHGTCCAGIIAAQNNDLGIRGVASGCNILPINVSPNGVMANINDLANAITWAYQHADILSCSWNFVESSSITEAITNARMLGRNGKGCPVVFSTGNDRNIKDDGTLENNDANYPSSLDGVIAVGAIDADGNACVYSQRGSALDLVALSSASLDAGDIVTTDRMGNDGYVAGNYYSYFTGTSAACPQVAGVAALMLSVNPALTEAQVRSILRNTARDLGATGRDDDYGYGLVDAYEAVKSAKQTYTISGPIFVTDSAYYSVNCPAGTTVQWEYYGNMTMTPNNPTNHQCMLKRTTSDLPYGMLFANVYNGNVRIGRILRNITSTFSGTYRQDNCEFHSVYHPAIASKTLSPGGVYFVHQGCRVHLKSELFKIVNAKYSGMTPDFWGLAPSIGEVQFELPYMSGGIPFQVYVNGTPSSNDYSFTFFAVSNNGNVSQSSLVVESADGGLTVTIVDADEQNASSGLIYSKKTSDVIADDALEWDVEVYDTVHLTLVAKSHVRGNRIWLDTSGWEAGTYVVRGIVGDELLAQKVQVR